MNLAPLPVRLRQTHQQARVLQQAGQPAEAAAALREAAALQPWSASPWEQIGVLESEAGAYGQSAQAYATAAEHQALSPAGWEAYGEALARSGDTPAALEIWQQALAMGGDAETLYDRIYRSQLAAGDLDAALQTARAWSARQPENAWPRYQSGLLLLALGQPDTALAALLEAARAAPEYSPAVETLRKAIGVASLGESPAYQHLVLGRALGGLGEWALAERLILKSTELAPEYAEAWAFLAEARQNLGKDGYAYLEEAVSLDPDSVIVQALLAVYWRRQDRPALALAALEKVMAQEPDQVRWVIEAGNVQAEVGDLIAARALFNRAIEMQPGSALAWKALAAYSLDHGDDISGTALPAARQALLLAPRDAQALDLMGAVFLALDDLVSAERFLQRATQQDSTLASAHLHLGQVYLQQGRREAAVAPLAAALRLAPNSATGALAARLLQELQPAQP